MAPRTPTTPAEATLESAPLLPEAPPVALAELGYS